MKLHVKKVTSLTSDEFERCKQLTMGQKGEMRRTVMDARRTRSDSKVILVKNSKKTIVGWSLLFNVGARQDCYFFVDHRYRRKGIGTAMFDKCRRLGYDPYLHPWDDRSRAFMQRLDQPKIPSYRRLV